MKRRTFLNSSVVAGAAAFVAPAATRAGSLPDMPAVAVRSANASVSLSRAWFEKNIGSRFMIQIEPSRSVAALLVDVKDEGSNDQLDQFSVLFQTADDAQVGGLHWLGHPEGRTQLSLEASHHVGDAHIVEAHFSLLRNPFVS